MPLDLNAGGICFKSSSMSQAESVLGSPDLALYLASWSTPNEFGILMLCFDYIVGNSKHFIITIKLNGNSLVTKYRKGSSTLYN